MRYDDTSVIVKGLTENIDRLLNEYAPGWVRRGDFGYPAPKSKKLLGSFRVNLKGSRQGQWFRFSQGFGGGPVKLLAYFLTGCTREPSRSDLAAAFKEARIFLGIDRGEIDQKAVEKAKAHQQQQNEKWEKAEARARVFREEKAMDLWQGARKPEETVSEFYFKSRVRGWDGFHTEQIRFHPEAYYSKDLCLPCVVCLVTGPDGNPVGVWRIYLNKDGTNFRDETGKKIKKGLGPCMESGGAIRLLPARDGTIGTCEGVETGYGAWNLNWREIPIWPCMSTGGMVNFKPPFGTDRVLIFPDGDVDWDQKKSQWREPPGLKAARAQQQNMIDQGLVSAIDPVPPDGLDHLDRWNAAYEAGMRVGGGIAA